MKVSFKKAFNILDGRLSTEMGDIYEMLNFIFDTSFQTIELPAAMRALKRRNPTWFSEAVNLLDRIKSSHNTDDFQELMIIIENKFSHVVITLEPLD